MSNYTEASIWTPQRLEHVRMRPTAYIHSREHKGLLHQASELIVNAIDELALMEDGKGKLSILLCIDAPRNTFQLVVRDNGRGLPIGKLLDSYSRLNTSGKFDTSAYNVSGGLYGLGAKVSAAVSLYFAALTTRPDGKAVVRINKGIADEKIERTHAPQAETGVMAIYEPDPEIFTDLVDNLMIDKTALLVMLQKYCFFRRLNIEFRECFIGIPEAFWTMKIPAMEKLFFQFWNNAELVFSEPQFDREKWLHDYYWMISRPFSEKLLISDSFKSSIIGRDKVLVETMVRYQAQIYYVKFDQNGGRFGMLNNLPIDDAKSTHLLTVVETVKAKLGELIADTKLRKWFIDNYKLALYIAIDVQCPGAEPSGTTKDAFYSSSFKAVFEPSLLKQLNLMTNAGNRFIADVYANISKDIEEAYLVATTGVTKVKNTNRLFESLNFPGKFTDCESSDRLGTELFLVEGDSAGGSEGRNKKTQGQYNLRGKPLNCITTMKQARDSASLLLKDDIYQDIIKIMGVNPNKFDLSTMYYKSGLIATDADDHGAHIASLLIGNLYVICPEMIEAGVWSIVSPPLYGLDYKNRKKGMPRIYLRDEHERVLWMIKSCYMNALKIGITSKHKAEKIRYLSDNEYVDFCVITLKLGEMINNIANELVLPPEIVEMLSYVTNYLTPQTMNTEIIRIALGVDKVTYDKFSNVMVLTRGRDDYVIPLENVRERLYETILPKLRKIAWNKLQVYITTKHNNIFSATPVSIVRLYDLFMSFADEFEVSQFKGLASMPPLDRNRTCMDPEYRTVYKITSVGDVKTIFNILGNNSLYRKQLVEAV